jgi:DNA-nicking Smr family endonuclease
MNYSEEEQQVLDWLRNHFLPDKDQELSTAPTALPKPSKGKRRSRNPAGWNLPEPDMEIDLHNLSVEEAVAKIEDLLEAMSRAGLTCLRIVHGGGNLGYGPIKKALDRNFRSVWKQRVRFYKTEPDNQGSSLAVLFTSK